MPTGIVLSAPFVYFRELWLNIHLKKLHVEYGQDELDSVGHFLASLTDTLAMASELSGNDKIEKKIYLQFESSEGELILDEEPDAIQEAFSQQSRLVWLSLQAVAAVKHMQCDLKRRASGVCLVSNVEESVLDDLQYKRESSRKLRLRVPSIKKQGTLSLTKKGEIKVQLDKDYDESKPL